MKHHPSVDIHPLVRQMIQILDQDITQVQRSLILLESLRSRVIKRDEAALTALLKEVRQQNRSTSQWESQRQLVRDQLGTMLGYPDGAMTLRDLLHHLSGSLHTELSQKRKELQQLLEHLQRQWELTSILLKDCARLNRRLLQTIFAQTGSGTYGPGGIQQTRTQSPLVNINI